jgi:hypothetical protein
MHRGFFNVSLLLMGLIIVAACGGRAALEAFELGEGEGGSNNASSSSGMGGDATSSTSQTSNTSNTSTTSVATSSSSGMGICDNSGDCQNCVQCAFASACEAVWNDCFNSQPCVEMSNCVDQCGMGPGCFQQCAQGNMTGAIPYIESVQCLLCDECPNDCEPMGQLCNF